MHEPCCSILEASWVWGYWVCVHVYQFYTSFIQFHVYSYYLASDDGEYSKDKF